MQVVVAHRMSTIPHTCGSPIALHPAMFLCLPLRHATLDEIGYPSPRILPALPYTHTDTSAQPCVYGFKSLLHPSQLVVFHPAAYKEIQHFLALLVAHTIATS